MYRYLKTRLNTYSERWLRRRIPASTSFTLSNRSIFIFPSRFGLGYLGMCLCLFLLGTNYQNNLIILLCHFLLAIFLLTLFLSYLNFSRLTPACRGVKPVFCGENAVLTITLGTPHLASNHRASAQGLVNLHWQHEQGDFIEHEMTQDENKLYLPREMHSRGKFMLPRVSIGSDYPLGLYRCWTYLDFDQCVTVYPKPITCPIQLHALHDEDDEGERESDIAGQDDFHSLRTYREGDPLHRVAWKQVAKGGEWMSKTFSAQVATTGWLMLPSSTANELETELGKLCYQVMTLSDRKHKFGLKLGAVEIAPAAGETHRIHCLNALATYSPNLEVSSAARQS